MLSAISRATTLGEHHTTGESKFQQQRLGELLHPSKFLYWVAAIFVIPFVFYKVGFMSGLILMFAILFVGRAVYEWTTRRRVKQFISSINPQDLFSN